MKKARTRRLVKSTNHCARRIRAAGAWRGKTHYTEYHLVLTLLLIGEEYNNRVYVLGHKYVLGPTQTHFKNESESEGIEKIKTEKNDNKTL